MSTVTISKIKDNGEKEIKCILTGKDAENAIERMKTLKECTEKFKEKIREKTRLRQKK